MGSTYSVFTLKIELVIIEIGDMTINIIGDMTIFAVSWRWEHVAL